MADPVEELRQAAAAYSETYRKYRVDSERAQDLAMGARRRLEDARRLALASIDDALVCRIVEYAQSMGDEWPGSYRFEPAQVREVLLLERILTKGVR